ncbi:MAG: hypothetical protein MZV65_36800 [Chromatiales bacterium]|nr:hypothetical protein [Chromatiales bacterium]
MRQPPIVNAGTWIYMDPFLRRRGIWDGYAERYACALTLHEMAAGTLPVWGDGSADPATLKTEITLDSERFDASIRQQALAFFSKALARDHRRRFDNAEQMLRTWRKVFEDVGRPVTTQPPQGQLASVERGQLNPAWNHREHAAGIPGAGLAPPGTDRAHRSR